MSCTLWVWQRISQISAHGELTFFMPLLLHCSLLQVWIFHRLRLPLFCFFQMASVITSVKSGTKIANLLPSVCSTFLPAWWTSSRYRVMPNKTVIVISSLPAPWSWELVSFFWKSLPSQSLPHPCLVRWCLVLSFHPSLCIASLWDPSLSLAPY